MTIEAIVLHFLDDMDAKVNAATELIEADRNSDSQWTAFTHPRPQAFQTLAQVAVVD